ncbi:AI-2E family transporter, partial [Azotobacter salinestris]
MSSNDRLLVLLLMLALLGACLWVLLPFASALFWAAVLAFASWPLMRLLTARLNGRESVAAGLLTAGWVILVAVPLLLFGFNLVDYIRELTGLINTLRLEGLPP